MLKSYPEEAKQKCLHFDILRYELSFPTAIQISSAQTLSSPALDCLFCISRVATAESEVPVAYTQDLIFLELLIPHSPM